MFALLLTIFAVYLTLAPLHSIHIASYIGHLNSRPWNDQDLLLLIVLIFFYAFVGFFGQKELDKKSVLLSLLLTIPLIIKASGIDTTTNSLTESTRLLLLIWVIPLVAYLRDHYGSKLLAILLVAIVVLHAQWAIIQFVLQHDLHLYPLGETRFIATAPGIAKFASSTGKLIRAYGPYAHPNPLGSTLVGATLLLLILDLPSIFTYPVFGLLALASVVTFSRAAWIGLLLAPAITYGMAWVKHYVSPKQVLTVFWGFTSLIILVFTPLVLDRLFDKDDMALVDRLNGLASARAIIHAHWWTGVGIGQYPIILQHYWQTMGYVYEPWQIAPIHSVPVLFIAEWGGLYALTLSIALVMFIYITHKKSGGFNVLSSLILFILWVLATATSLTTDHYLLTQSAPMVWYWVLGYVWWLVAVKLLDSQ